MFFFWGGGAHQHHQWLWCPFKLEMIKTRRSYKTSINLLCCAYLSYYHHSWWWGQQEIGKQAAQKRRRLRLVFTNICLKLNSNIPNSSYTRSAGAKMVCSNLSFLYVEWGGLSKRSWPWNYCASLRDKDPLSSPLTWAYLKRGTG